LKWLTTSLKVIGATYDLLLVFHWL